MNFISALFAKLFGINKAKNQDSPERTAELHDWETRRENQRNARIKSIEERIKNWMLTSVKQKGKLTFRWDSGHDEAFVYFTDNNEADKENYEDLEQYIIDRLDIPDAGEFEMKGNGTIYIDDNLVKAKYSSTMKGLIDYDEATQTEIYSEEVLDSGDKVLFAF